jgi:hypothetical protein
MEIENTEEASPIETGESLLNSMEVDEPEENPRGKVSGRGLQPSSSPSDGPGSPTGVQHSGENTPASGANNTAQEDAPSHQNDVGYVQ